MQDPEFIAVHRTSPTAFTRERSLPFRLLVLFLMNLLKSAIQFELDSFFAAVLGREVPQREITQSAFSQARNHLKHEAFVALNNRAAAVFYAEAPIRRWHGYRTLAVDGKTVANYLDLLVDLLLVRRLPPDHVNVGKRLVKRAFRVERVLSVACFSAEVASCTAARSTSAPPGSPLSVHA